MERWLNKVLNTSHPVINLRKEGLANIKKIKINQKKDRKNKLAIKDRVDKHPVLSYI
jgi:hypothetical protein